KADESKRFAMSHVAGARASAGLVSVEFIPQYELIVPGERLFATQSLNVLIRLSAAKDAGATVRPDLDLAIVLDRSGSMAGDKLLHAKQAGIDLVNQLEPRDRVTLITYDDVVTTDVLARMADSEGVLALREALLDIEPGGYTALGPALFEALDVLERQDGGGRLAHVLLLSDGLANQGEQRPPVIAARVAAGYGTGTTVSTLGVGADYNEDLMTLVADEGGGRYHYIEDGPQIPSVLAAELAGLTSSVAADLSVEFAAREPTSVVAVHGYVSKTEERRTSVRVGYLSSGQSREIVAQLEIPNHALRGVPGETIELGMITVRYRPIDSAAGADAPIVTLELPATIILADDPALARTSERTEVTVRVAEIESAAKLRAASEAVERNDFAAAEEIFAEAESEIGTKLENATDEAQRRKLQEEADALAAAQHSLKKAKQSGEGRKHVVKQYKEKSYLRLKGSTDAPLGD
ncbi:MAG TPA: VWA domain-containing protein, partial [Enhygromyxa sp.]|nr:VWA domain-containing protein [Enhygromyxa sp.]